MLRLTQISDLHFGPPFLPDVAEAALRLIHATEADAILISGDLTQRAKREQFVAARDYLQRLPKVPRLVIPGNHDVPLYRVLERLLTPHQLYREIISAELNPVLQLPGATIVGLDSTAPHTAITNGRITESQLEHCAAVFAAAPSENLRAIVAHHHFVPAPDSIRDRIVQGAARAMLRFEQMGVELIFGGHLHRAYIGDSLDFYPGINRDRGMIVIHSGTTTSRRGRGREKLKNSLNRIEIHPDVVKVSHYHYFRPSDSFEMTSEHYFRRGAVNR